MNTFYQDAIRSRRGDATNIREPRIRGSQRNVLFADTPDGARVFKFSSPELVVKDEKISNQYKMAGIPVPNITSHQYRGLSFEEYPIIPGRTLYEAIGDGIGADDIRRIYRQILDNFAKMARVRAGSLPHENINLAHYVARENVSTANNRTLGNVIWMLVYLMNLGADKNIGLFHFDITPKNVIISDDGHLAGFIDIETVGICNKNFAFGMMAAKYQQLGFDINELVDYYENITGDKLNRTRIATISNLSNAGKAFLWKNAQRKR